MTFWGRGGRALEIAQAWQQTRRDRLFPSVVGDGAIDPVGWIGVDVNHVFVQIDEPVLRQASPRVDARLDIAVVVDRGLCDLDDEQDVGGTGMSRRVEICLRPKQHDVRFGLVEQIQPDRSLHAHGSVVC